MSPDSPWRQALVEEVRRDLSAIRHLTHRPVPCQPVMKALGKVPREEFVPGETATSAYENIPLPIGFGQTISQPSIVALMTDMIHPQPDQVVLEIGTGSGYQAAILAEVVKQVYSVELVEALAMKAQRRLARLGYANIEIRVGDGCEGWPEHAPFDAILVTAAASRMPAALIDQLKPGGTLVIPIGRPYHGQDLVEVKKDPHGMVTERAVLPVAFVPLIGSENSGAYRGLDS
jgi:protein-L-isoaspartate(D-aspartate) O-methyltransferase